MMTEFTEYAPIGNMKQAIYRPAVLSVLAAMTKPTIATDRPMVMCQVLSCIRPELQPVRIPATPAKMNGGHVSTRVMVRLNPRVRTTLILSVSKAQHLNGACLRWKEGVERASTEMEVLHEAE